MSPCQQYAAVWPVDQQDTAQAVCQAESGGNPNALGDSGASKGLWQIDTDYHPEDAGLNLFDPATNARAALAIWQDSGFGAWSTYNSGAYRQYLTGSAPAASAPPSGSPLATVQSALASNGSAVLGLLVGGGLAFAALMAVGDVANDL